MAAPATAAAAGKPGGYSGVSHAKYVQLGATEPVSDRGTVTFRVENNRVKNFRLRGQMMNCGFSGEVPVTVAKIRLNASGKGSRTVDAPGVGKLKVTITVTADGKAFGNIRRPESAPGICNPDYPVRFTARRR